MSKEDLINPFRIDEIELVRKCREGDAEAIKKLTEVYLPRIKLLLERWQDIDTGMQNILAHEVLMIILAHIEEDRYDPEKGSLAAYIQGICHHHVSKYRRSSYWKTFCLDLTALEILRDSDIPDPLVDKLTTIANREYKKDAFESSLVKTIGTEAVKKYREKILKASRKHLVRRNERLSPQIIAQLDRTSHQYDLEAKELGEKIEALIQTLPEHYQRVLDMKYYEGRKTGDIAGKLKLEPDRVSNILSEAKKKIRKLWPKKDRAHFF